MNALRRMFFLGAVLLHSAPHTLLTATTPTQIGGVEIVGTCPANCQLVQNITDITTNNDNNGVRVTFRWTAAQLPVGMQMVGFKLAAQLVLKNGNIVNAPEQNVGATANNASVVLRGTIGNRNINVSDVKSGSVKVLANALTNNNPTIPVAAKEIVGNDGAQVNMRVRWTPPPAGSPCLAERTVNVFASAENAGGIKFDGSEIVRLSAGSVIVRLRGVGLRRKEMKNLQAQIQTNAVALTCGLSKPIQAASGGTGSNP